MTEKKSESEKYMYVYVSSNKISGILDINVFSNLKKLKVFLYKIWI